MKLVVVNKLAQDKIEALQEAVPGSVIEAYKSPAESLPHVEDADAIALWGFQDAEPLLQASSPCTLGSFPLRRSRAAPYKVHDGTAYSSHQFPRNP